MPDQRRFQSKAILYVSLGVLVIAFIWVGDAWLLRSTPTRPVAFSDRLGPTLFAILPVLLAMRMLFSGAVLSANRVKVRNVFSTRSVAWDQVAGFSLQPGPSWNRSPRGQVDLKDGSRIVISGIQANNIGEGAAQRLVDEMNTELSRR